VLLPLGVFGVITSGDAAHAIACGRVCGGNDFPRSPSTSMGLRGRYPASGEQRLVCFGMHGLYEANWAMHDCDSHDQYRRAL